MTSMKLALSASILALASACSAYGDDAATSQADAAPAAAAEAKAPHDYIADADPALFKVSDDDTTVYLFGTFHMLDPQTVWFDDAVADAFADSEKLVIEMVSPPPADVQQVVMSLGIDPAGEPLSETIGPDLWAKFTEQLSAFGVPPQQFEPMDPWFAAINLVGLQYGKLGFSPASGVETTLEAAATQRGLPIEGFETLEYQLGLFDDLPEESQVKFLAEGIEELAEAEGMIGKMIGFWRSGDIDGLSHMMNEGFEEDPALFQRLLVDRNANWAEQIDAMLDEPGTVFVAVGAGHLGGQGSVQEQLAERGIVVTRVEYD